MDEYNVKSLSRNRYKQTSALGSVFLFGLLLVFSVMEVITIAMGVSYRKTCHGLLVVSTFFVFSGALGFVTNVKYVYLFLNGTLSWKNSTMARYAVLLSISMLGLFTYLMANGAYLLFLPQPGTDGSLAPPQYCIMPELLSYWWFPTTLSQLLVVFQFADNTRKECQCSCNLAREDSVRLTIDVN